MTDQNLIQLIARISLAKKVVIVGPPCAGKTFLTEELQKRAFPEAGPLTPNEFKYIHTDNYIDPEKNNFEEAMYKVKKDVETCIEHEIPFIVEGIQAARLLRKGIELGDFNPDLIIKLEADMPILAERYDKRNPGKPYPTATLKAVNTVWTKYVELVSHMIDKPDFEEPTIIKIDTTTDDLVNHDGWI